MIVPMKKVTLILTHNSVRRTLTKLRALGVLHIEMKTGTSDTLRLLTEQTAKLEGAIYSVEDRAKKCTEIKEADTAEALRIADRISELEGEKSSCHARLASIASELDKIKAWGELDPDSLASLESDGISLSLYEMPLSEYKKLGEDIKALPLSKTKASVRFVCINQVPETLEAYRTPMPELSVAKMQEEEARLEGRLSEIESELDGCAAYSGSMKATIEVLSKETEFENYAVTAEKENISDKTDKPFDISYFTGYIPSDKLNTLKAEAKEHAWGLIAEDPTHDDNVPTKLQNNRFVSLIYPMTDFLGTVPGYFEYDISSWFLGFILVFFGIIFGDGGYGLLISGVAGALILKSVLAKKEIPPAFLLIALLGGATVLWGALTCTWFGLSPELLPSWLKALSIPPISNVYADTIWYPPWTDGTAGLTTTQNVQIFCFALALVQLSAAHIMGAVRNIRSLKALGDIGSVLMLCGIFYVVLSLVVNGAVFSLGLVVGGVPVGALAIACIGAGFVLNFIFSNYEGKIGKSIVESLKNIVSVLLGVVNIFSDIVSYIRLWAVGLAGAAISATVNDLASPMLGDLMFILFAVILLVFGHGLNMILNVLSVIVHGVRLNTLEFSSHLDMSWSGIKYKPFKE